MIPRGTIRLGTFAGIPFGVHPLWLVIVALITASLALGWYPQEVDGIAPGAAWALGLLSALLLFASIVAHEYGHAIVARRRGVEVEEIDLWLLGGVARLRGSARRPQDELAYALAGPAVTLVIAVVFGALLVAIPEDLPALRAVVAYQAIVNAAVLVFNLLPAFPLDGGRVLRALLWRASGDVLRATTTAAAVGRVFGFALLALGVMSALAGAPGGVWFAVIGIFLLGAARAEALHAEAEELFRGVPARELMTSPAICVPARATAAEAVREVILAHPHPAFPVVDDDGRALGMLAVADVEALAPARRELVPVGELADRDPGLLVAPEADVAALLEVPAFARMMRVAVVDADGRPLGVVSVTDAQRALEAHRRLGAAPAPLPERPELPLREGEGPFRGERRS